MSERISPAIRPIESRLWELGSPSGGWRRQLEELAEHHQDLKEAALQEGLGEAEAEAQASLLLGEPAVLAEELAAAVRHSSWWGRHPIIGYGLLPPVGVLVASILGLAAGLELLRLCFSADEWTVLAGEGARFTLAVAAVQGGCGVAIALLTAMFCWLARRSASGLRWAWLACVMCALQSGFCACHISPHAVVLGYARSPNWICGSIPLLIGVALMARRWRSENAPQRHRGYGERPLSGGRKVPIRY